MVVDLQELARRMLADYDATTPCQVFGEPLDLTTVQAYAVQTEIARLREQRGEKVIGYKVGCTSPAVQQQLGIAEPIFARVFDTGRSCSLGPPRPANGRAPRTGHRSARVWFL